MAGHTVSIYLKERGHDVIGFARRKSQFIETVIGDAFDLEGLAEIIINGDYDCIVNCIGVLNQFAETNKAQAVFLNAYLPHYLEDITRTRNNTQIIQISTDCVFSGNRGGYTEYDIRDGETFYDRSKALGEIENDKDFTLRTSIIGPDLDPNGIGLLNWFMAQDNTVNGYQNVMWTGLTTLELAKCIEIVAKERLSGLYNVVPNKSISKYELLKLCNEYIRLQRIVISPVNEPKMDKSLINKKDGLTFKVPDYVDMIKEMSQWINKYKYLYKHYC